VHDGVMRLCGHGRAGEQPRQGIRKTQQLTRSYPA
jgi:hypothetical protein